MKRVLLSIIFILYFLSFDWWNWRLEGRLWGLPLFLHYLVLMQALLSVAFILFVRRAWHPEQDPQLQDEPEGERP